MNVCDDLLFATCQAVAKRFRISLMRPSSAESAFDVSDWLQKMAQKTDIRIRQVTLKDQWWRQDGGPLLGFYRDQPCALLPKRWGGYQLVDLTRQRRIRVTERVASQIQAQAYYFYPALPVRVRNIRDVLRFSYRSLRHDCHRFVVIQILIHLLLLAVPISMGYLFQSVIPYADFSLLWQVGLILLVNIVLITLFRVSQAATLIRLRFKIESLILPAIWDRILKFPLRVFKQFSGGDLLFRSVVMSDILNTFTQRSILSVINGLMSVITLALLFYYSQPLAWMAFCIGFFMMFTTFLIHQRRLRFMRQLYIQFGRGMHFILELLSGIEKIKVANASSRVFKLWIDRFLKRNQIENKMRASLMALETFVIIMVIVNPLILYALVFMLKNPLSFSYFIAFNAAFTLFFMALLTMTHDMSDILRVLPLWEHAKPVVTAPVEKNIEQVNNVTLIGDIRVQNVFFRYSLNGEPLFKTLSLAIKPGEYVAIVGPSGAGKSTLCRLLLGFEEPEMGDIFYDDVNLKMLPMAAVRRQIGVVMQNTTLFPGTIFSNIIGDHTELTHQDAWEVAEKIGLADSIKALPMQMETIINEGCMTFSGGEIQQFILARALIRQPKILFLDDAMNELDDIRHAFLHDYLKSLQLTQVVVAHRLKTIQQADRIVVLDKGVIVQTGTFDTLMANPGLFADLAKGSGLTS